MLLEMSGLQYDSQVDGSKDVLSYFERQPNTVDVTI